MQVSRIHLYAVLAVAVAVAYGAGVGAYWVTDMVVFAVLASAVAYFCFARGAEIERLYAMLLGGARMTGVEQDYRILLADGKQVDHRSDQEERVPRSRIAHYVIVSRIKSTGLTDWLRRESDSPFERALLSEPGWRTFSGGSLEEITRKTPDASAKNAQ